MIALQKLATCGAVALALSASAVSAATVLSISGSGIFTETSDGLQLSGNYNGTLSGFDPVALADYRVSYTLTTAAGAVSGTDLGLADALEGIANAAMTGPDIDFDGQDAAVASVLADASGLLNMIASDAFLGLTGTFLASGSALGTDNILTFARDDTLDGFTVAQEDFQLEATFSAPSTVPLPASLPLLAAGFGLLILRRRARAC
jgi:hypothetical protein